jgi:hypothetical protein
MTFSTRRSSNANSTTTDSVRNRNLIALYGDDRSDPTIVAAPATPK